MRAPIGRFSTPQEELEGEILVAIIDFRIRPPYKEFLSTAMYAQAARRDGITRSIGFEPSNAAVQQSVELMLAEMDEAGIDLGVVVGRNSGALGSVPNAIVREFCDAHPGRFLSIASIDPTDRKRAVHDIDEAIAAGFLAVNIEPGGALPPLHIDDRRIYPIYAHSTRDPDDGRQRRPGYLLQLSGAFGSRTRGFSYPARGVVPRQLAMGSSNSSRRLSAAKPLPLPGLPARQHAGHG
jgi:hypothetical protein